MMWSRSSSGAADAPARARAALELRRRQEASAAAAAEAAPESFRAYIARVAPRYQFYRHCEELIGVLQRVADGELRRVIINLPPRHSKSETVSRLFPAYYLQRHPDRFVGVASYGADLAYTLSRASREHYERGGGGLHRAAKAVKYWLTRARGGLWAAGVAGPATGKGYHLGIVDDPVKDAEEAASAKRRTKVKDWWSSVWATREEPGGAQVVVQTRWHEDDLTGWLLSLEVEALAEGDEPEGWYIVNLPAIAEGNDAQLTYPTSCTVHPDWRADGEALCPERYPLERLQRLAKRIGAYFFGALFQGRPRPRSGGMFPEGAAPFVAAGALPAGALFIRYWDKAGAKAGGGDWTVGALLASAGDGIFYIVDVVRFQEAADARNKRMRQTAELDRQTYGHVPQWIEQPPGLAKESTDAVIRALAGLPAFANPVRGDKVERSEGAAAQWQAGNFRIVRGSWNRAFLEELMAFPNGANDDQVDGVSGGFQKLLVRLAAREADDTPTGVSVSSW